MNKEQSAHRMVTGPKEKQRFIKAGLVIVIIFVTIISAALLFNLSTRNHAQEVASTIEKSLTNKGATKLCDSGDPGLGPDNIEPYYGSYYEVQSDEQEAVSLVNSVASENGYKLTHASPTNRGPITDADQYLHLIYFDNTSKKSPLRRPQIRFDCVRIWSKYTGSKD